jgi:hypothetical protein
MSHAKQPATRRADLAHLQRIEFQRFKSDSNDQRTLAYQVETHLGDAMA